MNKVLVDGAVAPINEWLADLSRGNNKYASDGEYEWSYVRVGAVVSMEEYCEYWSGGIDEDVPVGTTHYLAVGIEFAGHLGSSIAGNIFPISVVDGIATLTEDIDEILGGGPMLQDATYDECISWVSRICSTASIVVYDKVDMSTIKLV